MIRPSQQFLRRGVLLLAASATAVLLGRELVNSSTYQLFGDYVVSVDIDEPVVALTFDDGPLPVNTPAMLDLLDRLQIRATFFMMGRNIERWPEVARQVVERGHEVGNHSYSHSKLLFMSPARVREEIERTDQLLRQIGVTGDIHFRPPHAAKFVVLPWVLTRMGKLSVMGDVDPEEWKRPGSDVMTATVLRQTRPGSIIGFHDTQGEDTRRAVEASVTALLAKGYRFETVSALAGRRESGR